MSQLALLRQFDAWRAEGRGLTLATVVSTAGSTYTKAGHRMLIANGGECAGLVSGGCLEADLACHAATLAETGNARLVTYDMRGDRDELYGLGIGCDGLMRILLQQLTPAENYEPLATIAEVWRGDVPAWCTVALGNDGEIRAGTTWVDTRGCNSNADEPSTPERPGAANTLRTRLLPLPRLLVLGAGADALPLVQMADQLGWRVTLADHRPDYLQRAGFNSVDARHCAPAAELASHLSLPTFAAAIVMSHHLATDRAYLAVLAGCNIPYVGLLGPPGRRDRLLKDLGASATRLAGRLHGPAGLSIGADSPASIALAILAEIHTVIQTSTVDHP